VIGWSALAGWQTFLLIQGTTLVAGGAIAAWMLYICSPWLYQAKFCLAKRFSGSCGVVLGRVQRGSVAHEWRTSRANERN
jgi:hypothetical protein